MRFGLNTEVPGLPIQDTVELGVTAESLGFDEVWTSEWGAWDGISPLAMIGARTSRVRLGTAILPLQHRSPALLAMTASTMHELTGGRFMLGLGTSTRLIVERWIGQSFDRPVTRYREYLTAVRGLLDGERVEIDGETIAVRGFRLQRPPSGRVPIYAAALGQHTCRLAGALSDGVILYLKTPDGVRQALEWVREGAGQAGRDPAGIECVLMIPVAGVEAEEQVRAHVASYARVPDYGRSFRKQGFSSELDAISTGWESGRQAAAEAIDAAMLANLVLPADREAGAGLVGRFSEAGVTTLMLLPIPGPGEPGDVLAKAENALRGYAPGG